MKVNVDVQRSLCKYLYADTLAPVIDKGSTLPWCEEAGVVHGRTHDISLSGREGEVTVSIRQPALLSTFALVCRTWHEELQVYRQQQADTLVAQFIELSPVQALELLNISNYSPEDWTLAPDVSILTFEVYLGSRLQLAISLKRRRVKDSPVADQELLVQCGVAERTDGRPWLSPELSLGPHETCSKSGWDFTDEDNDIYDLWYQQTNTHIHEWLTNQFTALSAINKAVTFAEIVDAHTQLHKIDRLAIQEVLPVSRYAFCGAE